MTLFYHKLEYDFVGRLDDEEYDEDLENRDDDVVTRYRRATNEALEYRNRFVRYFWKERNVVKM